MRIDMIPLRKKEPARRDNPSKSPTGENWGEHKPELKEDFSSYCGYCSSHDSFRHTYFEVDHFVPKSLLKLSETPDLCKYSNLVYSCKFCNNAKLSKWPSGNEDVHNDGTTGFVDPCAADFSSHFARTDEGAIFGVTDLGKWMSLTAFKFDKREKAIIILWNLDNLKISIEQLTLQLKTMAEASDEYKTLYARMTTFCAQYYTWDKELKEFYDQ